MFQSSYFLHIHIPVWCISLISHLQKAIHMIKIVHRTKIITVTVIMTDQNLSVVDGIPLTSHF